MDILKTLRRKAKALRKDFAAGDAEAANRVRAVIPEAKELKHADALHVIACEEGHASWPKMKATFETQAMTRDERAERLKMALYFGQHWVVDQLLEQDPGLGRHNLGLAIALYDIEHVCSEVEKNPAKATDVIGVRRPMTHLAFSQHIHGQGSKIEMLAAAEVLVAHGADVNDFHNYNNDPQMPLSALYGALGHARNMELARWLLENGADPNDNESLYHSTELGHREGLKLLLKHGAKPEGTNALPRALDFNDHEAVQLLLDAGADPNEGVEPHPSGEPSFVIPALHQAARRMCDARMVQMLLDAGADPSMPYKGMTPFAMAMVYGNAVAAELIAAAGASKKLSPDEALLTLAVYGPVPENAFLDPAKLPDEYRNLLRSVLAMPDRRGHVERLVAMGLEWDKPDEMGVTPVQIAGWEGLPDMMAYFLSLKPDLGHINGYGGTLLSTIIHGSENCPDRDARDHIACARLALEEGVALPQPAIDFAGEEGMAAFLADWAEAHPGQVVAEGIG